MIRLRLIAEFEDDDTTEEARRRLDAFRESITPGTEYGITFYEDDETVNGACKFCDRERMIYAWHNDQPVCSDCWDERLAITR